MNRYNNDIDNFTAGTLSILSDLIYDSEKGLISSEKIQSILEQLAADRRLTIVGKGTNRIVVKVNGDISPLVGFKQSAVIKIPYKTDKGLNDNLREYLLYKYLYEMSMSTNDSTQVKEINELLDLLPVINQVEGYPLLIAQEEVIPIDVYQPVTKRATEITKNNIAGLCLEYILSREVLPEYKRLMYLLDKYAIVADLNPLVTPFQYGFKNINGRNRLTILDTGYAIPKLPEYWFLIRQTGLPDYKYLIVEDQILFAKSPTDASGNYKFNITINKDYLRMNAADEKENLITIVECIPNYGLYLNDRPVTNSELYKSGQKRCISDITYFKDMYRVLQRFSRENQSKNSPLVRYFNELVGSKSL